jgi:hypothetical protein
VAGARRHVAATGGTVICVTRFGLAARIRLLRCSARQLQKYVATMLSAVAVSLQGLQPSGQHATGT